MSFGVVGLIVRRWEAEPTWRVERAVGTGRVRKTTSAQDRAMVKEVVKQRGKEKMTSKKVQRRVAKKVSAKTVRRRLQEAGLRWLRRRRKSWVPEDHRESRLEWATRVKASPEKFLRRWIYTDGCSFYLDRDAAEFEEGKKAALGPSVWRHTDEKAALYKDNVGPSSYRKSQGHRVVVWGLLIGGRLCITILPAQTYMNRFLYTKIIQGSFKKWLRRVRQPFLVQDYEKCLWSAEPQAALKELGVEVSDWHPKYSPDLNAIENAWKLLRDRLADTQPAEREDRSAFVRRLRAAASWINRHHKSALLSLSRNQKIRANDVQDNDGYKTKW